MDALQPGENLQAALDALAPAAVLRLAAGEHRLEAPLCLRRGVRLVGAGAAHTRITRLRAPHSHLVEAHPPSGEALWLEDLALAWADGCEDRPGVYLFQSDVLVVAGGQVALRACRLAGSEAEHGRSNDMYGGSGLRVAGDGTVRADGCEIVTHGGHGVTAGDRAVLALANCWVAGNRGSGLLAEDEAAVEARATAFVENERGGVAAFDQATLTLVEATIQANRRGGVRLHATGAARLEGCTLEANGGPGVEVKGGSLTITGGVIRRNGGDGLAIAEPGHVAAADLMIEENRGFGVTAGTGATVELTRVAILGNARGGIERA